MHVTALLVRHLSAFIVVLLLGALGANRTHAQYTWNSADSGIWNYSPNWTGGIPVSGGTAVLNFAGSTTYSALDDITGVFTLNQLNFTGTGSGTRITVGVTGGGTSFTLGGATPSITSSGSADVFVTAPLTLSAATTITNSGSGLFAVTGAITAATFPITLSNTGGGNTFITGAITFSSGGSGFTFNGGGTGGNTTISGATTFTASSSITNNSTTGRLSFGNIAIGANQTLTFNSASGANTLVFGVISGSGPATGVNTPAVSITGAGTTVFTGTNTFTAGTPGTSSAVQINSGATLGITQDTSLGAAPGTANTANSTVINDGTLSALATIGLSGNRGIAFQGTTNNTIRVAENQILSTGVIITSVSGNTPVTIDGGGIMSFSGGVSTFSTGAAGITVRGGSTLRGAFTTADTALGNTSNPIFLGDATTSGTLMATSAFTLTAGRTITIGAGGGTLNATGAALTYAGQILGSGPLTYAGGNTFTFTPGVGAAPYSPTTVRITQGSTVNHVMTNSLTGVYASGTILTFGGGSGTFSAGPTGAFVGGGVLGLTGGASASTQTLSGISVANGLAQINLTNGTGGLTLNFTAGSSITRSAGTVLNFNLGASTSVDVTNVTTGATLTNGILGGNVTAGGSNPTDFATVNGSNLIVVLPTASYTTVTAGDVATAWAAGNNVRINSATISNTPVLNASTNSLKFDTGIVAGTTTLTLNGTNHLSSGGILVSSALTTVGTLVISDGGVGTNRLSAGPDSGGATAADLTITVANTAAQQLLRIDAGIVDNGSGGAVSLVKAGQGLLILNAAAGSNTYSGVTNVWGGTLRIGQTNTLPTTTALSLGLGTTLEANNLNVTVGSIAGAGNVNLGAAAGGRLIVNGSASTIYSGVVSGTTLTDIGLEFSGSGTTTLLGANTFALAAASQGTVSAVRINTGATVRIFGDTGLGAAPGSVLAGRSYLNLNGGTLQLEGSFDYNANRSVVLTAASSVNAGANWGPGQSFDPAILNVGSNTVSFGAGSGAIFAVSPGNIAFSGGTNTINASATLSSFGIGSTTLTTALNFSGAATLTASGSGYVTYSGAQLLSGTLTITNTNTNTNANTGNLASVLVTGAITAGGNSIVINNNGAANTALTGAITFTTPTSITNNGSGGGQTFINGGITLTGPAALTVTNNSTKPLTMGGALTAGIGSLTIGGSGTTLYTGAITFTGPSSITINSGAGSVQFGAITFNVNGTSTFTNNSSNTVSVNGSMTTNATRLVFNGSGSTQFLTTATLNSNAQTILTGSSNLTFAGATTLGTTTITNSGTGTIAFNGAVSGANSITPMTSGTGTINFTNSNLTGSAWNNAGSVTTTMSGPVTMQANWAVYQNSTNALTISGTIGGAFGLTVAGSGNTNISGNIQSAVTTLTIGGGTNTTHGPIINGVAPAGTAVVTLSGTNAYTGITTLSAGILQFSAATNLGSNNTATALSLNGGILRLTAPTSSGTINAGQGAALGVTVGGTATIDVVNSGNTLNIPGTLVIGNGVTLIARGAGGVSVVGNTANNNASGNILNLGTGTLSLANLTHTHTAASTMNLGGSGNITIGGLISNNGANATNLAFVGLTTGTTGLFTPGTTTIVGTANTYTGTTVINSGTVLINSGGLAGTNGPLGNNSAITIASGTLAANPAGGSTTTPLGNLTYSAGSQIIVNNTSTGGANVTKLSFGTLTRTAPGTLIINSGTAGVFGTDSQVSFSATPTLTNTIVNASIVGQLNGGGNTDADFLTYTGTGSAGNLLIATYTGALPTTGGLNSDIRNAAGTTTLTGNTLAFALQVNGGGTVDLNGSNLTLGNNANQAGLILNAGSTISTSGGGNLAFGAAEGVIYVNGASSIGTNITGSNTNALTIHGPGSLSLVGATNGLTGGTITVNRSTLILGSSFVPGARPITLNGGTLTIAPSSAVSLGTAIATTTLSIGVGGAVINIPVGSSLTTTAGTVAFGSTPTTLLGAGNATFGITTATATTSPGLIIGTLNNTGVPNGDYTGTVTFNTGVNSATPSTQVTLNSGTLQLQAGNLGTNRPAINNLTVNGGLVRVMSNGPPDSTTASISGQVANAVTLNGGTLDVNGFSTVIGGLRGGNGLPGGAGTITNSSATAATLTINFNNGPNTDQTIFGGAITDSASISTIDGTAAGTLNLVIGSNGGSQNGRPVTLTNANTFHGTLTVGTTQSPSNNVNSLFIGNDLALQNATLVNNLLTTAGSAGVAFSTGPRNPDNNNTSAYFVNSPIVGAITGYGNLQLPSQPINLQVGNNNLSTTYSGVINGGNASVVAFTKIGAGTLALANINTFAGIAAVSSGTLTTAAPYALFGAGPLTANVAGYALNVATIRDLRAAPATTSLIPSTGQTVSLAFVPGGTQAGNTLNPTGSGVLDLYGFNQVALSIQGNGTISTGNYVNSTLFITGTVSNSFAGGITGGGGIMKTNTSTQILTGAGLNTYSGDTVLLGGTLQASFGSQANAANVLSPNSRVVYANINGANPSNGVLLISGSNAASSTSSQTLAGITLQSNTIGRLNLANPVSSATLNLTIGSPIVRGAGSVMTIITPPIGTVLTSTAATPTSIQQIGGGTININYSGAGTGAAGSIITDANGTAYLTFLTDWAVKNAANDAIVAGSQVAGFYTGNAISSGSNTLMTASFTGPATSTTFNSLHLANVAAGTITLTAGQTYTISTGGILQSTAALAAGTIGASANQGSITSASNELVVTNYRASDITINSAIVDNGANATGLTVNFQSNTLQLGGTNSFTGPLNIAAGAVNVNGNLASGITAINNYGGTLTLNNNATWTTAANITGTGGITNTSVNAITLTGTINLSATLTNNNAAANLTIGASGGTGNTLIGVGALTNTAGTLTLNTANIFTGNTTLTAGTTTIMNSLSLQNSVVSSNVANAGATEAGNGLRFGTAGAPLTAATFNGLSGSGNLVLNNPNGVGVALTLGFLNGASAPTGLWSGAGSINKIGTGALTFAPAANTGHSYTGATVIQNGSLALTFAAAGSTASVIYNGVGSGRNLTLGGTQTSLINSNFTIPTQATVTITASTANGTTSTQNFDSLTLAANSNNTLTLTNTPAASATATLNVGLGSSINRSTGAFLNIANTPGTGGTTNITASLGAGSAGILTSGGVVVGAISSGAAAPNGTDWAARNAAGTAIVGLSTLGGYSTVNTTPSGGNWDFTASFTATTTSANSIRVSGGTVTLTLAAGTTSVATGGILHATNAAGNFTIAGAAGTSLTSGSNELLFITDRANDIVVGATATPTGAQIINNGSNPLALSLVGNTARTLTINSVPTYTGQTYIGIGTMTLAFTGTNVWGTSAVFNNGTLNFNQASGNTITYSNVISGTGTVSQIGTGTTILGGANTYTGVTTVSGGILRLSNASALPSTTSLVMNANTTAPQLDLNGNNVTVGALTANVAAGFAATGLPVITTGTAGSVTFTFGSLGYNTMFAGIIQNGSGTMNVTKNGIGQTTFTNVNTYTGTTTVNAGTLVVAGSGSLGTGAVVLNNANTGVGTGTVLSIANATQTIGSLSSGTLGTPSSGSNYIQLSLGATALTVNQTSAGDFTSGNITGTNGSLNLIGTNTLTVRSNYYGGATTIGGTATLATDLLANGGLVSGIGASSNAAANLVLNGGTLKYTGAATSTNRLFTLSASSTIDSSGTGALTFSNTGSIVVGGSGSRTLNLVGSNTGANTLAASFGDPSGGGSTSLVKNGAGRWVLTGTSVYSGSTSVNGGTLQIGTSPGVGSITTSGVSIASGATLNGTGTVNGAVTVSGNATLRGGAAGSYDTLTVAGNVTMQDQSILNVNFKATPTQQSSLLNITGGSNTFSFSQNSGEQLVINVTGNNDDTALSYTFVLVQTANSSGIVFNNSVAAANTVFTSGYQVNPSNFASSSLTSTLFVSGDGTALMLTIATPEPHHILLVCAAVLLVVVAVRRRRLAAA